ncbi:putative polysaccharide biosynthesis protein [Modestobacter italicus]|uniref:Polysaccharide biosynthesis protein n=1 Tax=Modestobacter italicus (strain DSM 44449 / CECT 9708 / BC 501) TaxID=2732864 RepID=I4ER87_MODI5|nr:polysaccharide pyruvyl transferase family protein [Modestobacter marinus]CCH85900.1 putative polysaccharide biosynthesis protein [Modestobacter marinus]
MSAVDPAPEVELVHWNPRRRVSRFLPGRITRPVGNFGDLLGPMVVREMLRRAGLTSAVADGRLLSIGSVLHFARDGDVVWGSGVNGKSLDAPVTARRLDVRAVRGPRTRAVLQERGIAVPEVYGDPGLLVGQLWPRESLLRPGPRSPVTVVPNLHDAPAHARTPGLLDPRTDVGEVLARIANSDFVVGSSLHGIVVAESFGIPARLVRPGAEPLFKYEDYYAGTGRPAPRPAASVEAAMDAGGEPPAVLDPALAAAFPRDLWR